jgi:hypothetical protein
LRLGWPGITEFKSDEAHIASLAFDVAAGRALPLQGTGTSIGLPKSALSIYLYALPSLLWRSPLWLTLCTAAWNVLAIALCWRFARRYWGPAAAWCAALLLATNPWAIHFSRKIWEPNLLSPFVLAWAITGALAFVEGRRWALALHLILLSAAIQLHYSALALVPVTAFLLVRERHRVDWRSLGFGLALAIALAIPFVLHLLTRSDGAGWTSVLRLLSTARFDRQSLRFWWVMATGSEIHALAGADAYQEFLRTLPPVGVVPWAMGALVVSGICLWLWKVWRHQAEEDNAASLLVAFWALSPLLLFSWHVVPTHLHYYVVSVPAQCLAAGFAVARLAARLRPWLRRGLFVMVIAIAVAQSGTWLSLLSFVGSRATPGGFGMPLGLQLQAAQRAAAPGLPITVVGHGDDPRFADWPAVFDVLLHSVPHRLVDGTRAAVFMAQPSVVLVTPGTGTALRLYSQTDLVDPADRIATRSGEEPLYVLRLDGGERPPLELADGPRQLANGAEIVGYGRDTTIVLGQPLDWIIAWRVNRSPSDGHADYHLFNHLLDARGQRWAQADGATLPTGTWREGDLVVQAFELAVPTDAGPGPFRMRVGMYTYPGLESQPVLDAMGQPVTNGVTLGPLVQSDRP